MIYCIIKRLLHTVDDGNKRGSRIANDKNKMTFKSAMNFWSRRIVKSIGVANLFYQNQSKTTAVEYAVVQSITATSVVDCGDDPVRYLWAAKRKELVGRNPLRELRRRVSVEATVICTLYSGRVPLYYLSPRHGVIFSLHHEACLDSVAAK